MNQSGSGQIDTVMHEARQFPPSPEFAAGARIKSMEEYQKLWDDAKQDPPAFWDKLAKQELHWFTPYNEVLKWNEPYAEWFVGGKTNASYNCLDAHLDSEIADKTALIFEGEPGDQVIDTSVVRKRGVAIGKRRRRGVDAAVVAGGGRHLYVKVESRERI